MSRKLDIPGLSSLKSALTPNGLAKFYVSFPTSFSHLKKEVYLDKLKKVYPKLFIYLFILFRLTIHYRKKEKTAKTTQNKIALKKVTK